MIYPISGAHISPFLLAGIGFVIGLLGGFFGVGGGFLAGPLLFWAGLPMNFVVGTDLAQITGTSIVGGWRHRALGNVDVRLGLLMVVGTIPGVELGAQVIERLKLAGNIDNVIGTIYIIVLLCIGFFTAWESIRAIRLHRASGSPASDILSIKSLLQRSPLMRIPPAISLPVSGIPQISIWVIILLGVVTGFLSGLLGVGGGFLRMPLMLYVFGLPTCVAVGTDLFEIVFSAGYGTLTHGLKGNVDILAALTMQAGAALGAQIGALATRTISGPVIRLLFAALPFLASILVLVRLH
jgi:uncharacterized membrane protein YfcA